MKSFLLALVATTVTMLMTEAAAASINLIHPGAPSNWPSQSEFLDLSHHDVISKVNRHLDAFYQEHEIYATLSIYKQPEFVKHLKFLEVLAQRGTPIADTRNLEPTVKMDAKDQIKRDVNIPANNKNLRSQSNPQPGAFISMKEKAKVGFCGGFFDDMNAFHADLATMNTDTIPGLGTQLETAVALIDTLALEVTATEEHCQCDPGGAHCRSATNLEIGIVSARAEAVRIEGLLDAADTERADITQRMLTRWDSNSACRAAYRTVTWVQELGEEMEELISTAISSIKAAACMIVQIGLDMMGEATDNALLAAAPGLAAIQNSPLCAFFNMGTQSPNNPELDDGVSPFLARVTERATPEGCGERCMAATEMAATHVTEEHDLPAAMVAIFSGVASGSMLTTVNAVFDLLVLLLGMLGDHFDDSVEGGIDDKIRDVATFLSTHADVRMFLSEVFLNGVCGKLGSAMTTIMKGVAMCNLCEGHANCLGDCVGEFLVFRDTCKSRYAALDDPPAEEEAFVASNTPPTATQTPPLRVTVGGVEVLFPEPQYIEINSGSCASHAGYSLITNFEECAAALAAVFSATGVTNCRNCASPHPRTSSSNWPTGCQYHELDGIQKFASVNTNTASTGACSNSRRCLCGKPQYFEIQSGTCASAGYSLITTVEECADALASIGERGVPNCRNCASPITRTNSGWPQGCQYHTLSRPFASVNTNTAATGACSNGNPPGGRCLCKSAFDGGSGMAAAATRRIEGFQSQRNQFPPSSQLPEGQCPLLHCNADWNGCVLNNGISSSSNGLADAVSSPICDPAVKQSDFNFAANGIIQYNRGSLSLSSHSISGDTALLESFVGYEDAAGMEEQGCQQVCLQNEACNGYSFMGGFNGGCKTFSGEDTMVIHTSNTANTAFNVQPIGTGNPPSRKLKYTQRETDWDHQDRNCWPGNGADPKDDWSITLTGEFRGRTVTHDNFLVDNNVDYCKTICVNTEGCDGITMYAERCYLRHKMILSSCSYNNLADSYKLDTGVYSFIKRTSGVCGDVPDASNILDVAICARAARVAITHTGNCFHNTCGLNGNAYSRNHAGFVKGCQYHFQTSSNPFVSMNSRTGSVSVKCTAARPCICKLMIRNAWKSYVRKSVPGQPGTTLLTNGGKCGDIVGRERIDTLAECSQAGSALGLSDTTASSDNQRGVSYDPKGCYFENGQLKFNGYGNYGSCTTSDQCLCKTNIKQRHCPLHLPRCMNANNRDTFANVMDTSDWETGIGNNGVCQR